MPDIPLDAVVANRFISSLSKSLQALCHGCMDFDSGIEIGGYLFVKIDCDTKVDYVLEEKVEKGSNNSMKFVSNSYLSKKDQLKQTRDGSCSPVLELQSFQQPPKTSYQYPGAPHHRSQFPYSPQPHVSRGAHKRSWPGMERDWRPSPKKPFQPSRMPQPPSATATQSSHNRNPLNPAFLQPHPPSSNNVSNNNENVNVKKEALDGDDRLQGSNQLGEGEGAEIGFDPLVNNKITIKNEPGGLPEHEEDSNADGEENFLQQSENSGGASHTDSSSSNRLPQRFENDNNSNSAKDNAEYQSDYEGAEGDVSYGQSSLDEQGEGATPGEGPGFDVIEIDDEDEDVKAMFGNHTQSTSSARGSTKKKMTFLPMDFLNNKTIEKEKKYLPIDFLENKNKETGIKLHQMNFEENKTEENDINPSIFQCPTCLPSFKNMSEFTHHMVANPLHESIIQTDPDIPAMVTYALPPVARIQSLTADCIDAASKKPFRCALCGWGYRSLRGLQHHMAGHAGTRHACPFCEVTTTQAAHVATHVRRVHKFDKCRTCQVYVRLGEEYDNHACCT